MGNIALLWKVCWKNLHLWSETFVIFSHNFLKWIINLRKKSYLNLEYRLADSVSSFNGTIWHDSGHEIPTFWMTKNYFLFFFQPVTHVGCQAKLKITSSGERALRVAGISILITAIIEFVPVKDASFGEVLPVGSYLDLNHLRWMGI